MGFDTSCLYSTVRCTVPAGRTFGYLPPHGRKLTHNEEFVVFGDIKQALIRHDRGEARRSIIAFEKDLINGNLEIVSTPNVILTDDANPGAASKMLRLHNGTLGVTDPCWRTSTSLSPTFG